MRLNLYRVTLRGMTSLVGSNTAYGLPFVVAESPDKAIKLVQSSLEARQLWFQDDRTLKSVELLAENCDYPSCGYQLFLQGEND